MFFWCSVVVCSVDGIISVAQEKHSFEQYKKCLVKLTGRKKEMEEKQFKDMLYYITKLIVHLFIDQLTTVLGV